MSRSVTCKLLAIAVLLPLHQGCISVPPRLSAVPTALTAKAEIPGMPGVRYVGGGDMTDLFKVTVEGFRREQTYLASQGHSGELPPAVYLAVSGGGDNGAYTAGLLARWLAEATNRADSS